MRWYEGLQVGCDGGRRVSVVLAVICMVIVIVGVLYECGKVWLVGGETGQLGAVQVREWVDGPDGGGGVMRRMERVV
jgi:hypothetical protein